MPGARGQTLAIDLLIAVMVFLLLMAAVLAVWTSSANDASRQMNEVDMQQLGEKAGNILLMGNRSEMPDCNTSPGDPISLVKENKVFDENRVNQFIWANSILADGQKAADSTLANGLKGAWHFNENCDDALSRNNCGFNNSATADAEGLWGTKALNLAGGSKYALVPHNNNYLDITGSGLTISAWVKANSLVAGNGYGILLKTSGATGTYEMWIYGNQPRFGLKVGSNHYRETAEFKLQPSIWYHLTYTFDGQNMRIFVNGDLNGTYNHPGNIANVQENEPIYIGSSGISSGYFNGTIEEARIYKRALPESEIKSLCEWTTEHVRARFLISDSNYYFRLADPGTMNTVENTAGDKIEAGVPPDDPNIPKALRDKFMRTKITRAVTYQGDVKIAEFTIYKPQ